jgi:hypothetical protein
MLDHTSIATSYSEVKKPVFPVIPVVFLNGRGLKRHKWNRDERGEMAAATITGLVRVKLSIGQVADIFGVPASLVRKYLTRNNGSKRKAPTDAHLDKLVARYGADRVMAALDRATMPRRVAAE